MNPSFPKGFMALHFLRLVLQSGMLKRGQVQPTLKITWSSMVFRGFHLEVFESFAEMELAAIMILDKL